MFNDYIKVLIVCKEYVQLDTQSQSQVWLGLHIHITISKGRFTIIKYRTGIETGSSLVLCLVTFIFLPSATKLRRLCFYTCLSVHGWGVGIPACTEADPPGADTPPGADIPPGADTPLGRDGYCCGRYATYWNAFLFALYRLVWTCDKSSFTST